MSLESRKRQPHHCDRRALLSC